MSKEVLGNVLTERVSEGVVLGKENFRIPEHFLIAEVANALVATSRSPVGRLLVSLNNPERRNCLSQPLILDLTHTIRIMGLDPSVRVIILTGSATAFCTGLDLHDCQWMPKEQILETLSVVRTTMDAIQKPLIAAVAGHALGGGCELALMCDIVLCTDTAIFGFPEVKLGLIPGGGGISRLSKVLGKNRAMEMILTGRFWTGRDSEKWGMASKVCTNYESLIADAILCAQTISENDTRAVRAAKTIMKHIEAADDGVEGRRVERELFWQLLGSDEQISLCTRFTSRKNSI